MKNYIRFVPATSPNGTFRVSVIFTEIDGIDEGILTSHEKAVLSLIQDEKTKASERLRLLTQLVQSLEDKGSIYEFSIHACMKE